MNRITSINQISFDFLPNEYEKHYILDGGVIVRIEKGVKDKFAIMVTNANWDEKEFISQSFSGYNTEDYFKEIVTVHDTNLLQYWVDRCTIDSPCILQS